MAFSRRQARERRQRQQALLGRGRGTTDRRSEREILLDLIDDEERSGAAARPVGTLRRLGRRLGPKGRFLAVAVVIAAAITLVTVSWERFEARTTQSADPRNAAQVALGKSLYASHCAYCHGDRLEGKPGWDGEHPDGRRPALPLDGTGAIWRLGDHDLRDVIKYGGQPFSPPTYQNDMPGYEMQLSDADIWALVAFVKSTWPEDVIKHQAEAAEERRKAQGG
jgi:mono/diheme cytochrome c family protein